jgi:hypothetical protein
LVFGVNSLNHRWLDPTRMLADGSPMFKLFLPGS